LEVERLLNERKTLAHERYAALERVGEDARAKAAAQVAAAEEAHQRMAVQNTELRAECDKSCREAKSSKEMLEKLQRLSEEERRVVESALEQLKGELAKSARNIESENAKRMRLQNENTEHRLVIDKLRTLIDNQRNSVEQRDKLHDSELGTLRLAARDATRLSVDR
jgi:hypothetical protein